jgi:hypothetical protein
MPATPGRVPADGPYRHEGATTLIELRLTRIEQLFNSLDPAPFHQQDLDREAEAYLVDALRDLPGRSEVRLVLHLPASELARVDPRAIQTAIQHYFEYRRWAEARRLRREFRIGLLSLAIGVSFLLTCLGLRGLLLARASGAIAEALGEGLLISGWVAMWRPIEIFLYEWWPIWRTVRRYERLATLPVECRVPDGAA